jgi:hypothetical protein
MGAGDARALAERADTFGELTPVRTRQDTPSGLSVLSEMGLPAPPGSLRTRESSRDGHFWPHEGEGRS